MHYSTKDIWSEINSVPLAIVFLFQQKGRESGPGGGTPIYGLDRYVPPDRVWFLRVSILK